MTSGDLLSILPLLLDEMQRQGEIPAIIRVGFQFADTKSILSGLGVVECAPLGCPVSPVASLTPWRGSYVSSYLHEPRPPSRSAMHQGPYLLSATMFAYASELRQYLFQGISGSPHGSSRVGINHCPAVHAPSLAEGMNCHLGQPEGEL